MMASAYSYLGFGGFPDALSPLEIEHFFTASAEEAVAIAGAARR
jgi:hypothetical protein